MRKVFSYLALVVLLIACNNSSEKAGDTEATDADSTQHYYIIDTTMTGPTEDPDIRDTTAVKKDKMDGGSIKFKDKEKK